MPSPLVPVLLLTAPTMENRNTAVTKPAITSPNASTTVFGAEATVETGGGTVDLDGVEDSLVVEPTVLSGVTNDMAAACNEHFGPIAPVIPFSEVDEAVELANDTEYGLSGSVHAGDVAAGRRIAGRLEPWLNTGFWTLRARRCKTAGSAS